MPELDMNKATMHKFTNSDKSAAEINLGTNPETFRVAYLATKIAIDPSIRTTPEGEF